VPFAAGGTPDVVGRIISQQLAAQTGQAFVVENRPGADGVLGAQTVAESPPDGYTLLVTSSSFVVNPSFHKKLPFDVVRDFEPVSNLAVTEAYILGVNPRLPVRTVQELIALTRRADSKISFGSPGVGNGLHLAAELFKSLTRTQMVHVPYRGAAPAITGLIAGDVQVMFMTPPSSLPFIEGEKARALAYTFCAAPRRTNHGGGRRTRNGGARELDRHVCTREDPRCGARPAARGGAKSRRDRNRPRTAHGHRRHSAR
jgi:tripartite-type tricarboxylate transporter receptor subunit TctC